MEVRRSFRNAGARSWTVVLGAWLVQFGPSAAAAEPSPCQQLPSDDDWAILDHAAKAEDRACVGWLLAHSPEIETSRMHGNPPLHRAVFHGNARLVAMLLGAGEDVNAVDKSQRTPLWHAASNGDAATSKVLLDAGADVDRADAQGETPLFAAAHSASGRMMIELLVKWGADASHRNHLEWSAADVASSEGDEDTALDLQQWGASLRPEHEFRMALHGCNAAALRAVLDLASLTDLSDLTMEERPGEWPICYAAKKCDSPVVELLLYVGASAEEDCGHGETPLQAAVKRNNREVAELLSARTYDKPVWSRFLDRNIYLGIGSPTRSRDIDGYYGLRPELVLLRTKPSASRVGVGLYGEALTRSFADVRMGGGLLLVTEFPVVPSFGTYVRPSLAGEWRPGVAGGLFIGYHAAGYEQATEGETNKGKNVGVRIDLYRDLSGPKETRVLVGAQLDLFTVAEAFGFLLIVLFGGRFPLG